MRELSEKLESYRSLLEDRSGRYVLIQTDNGSKELETCLVYDLETQSALVEEDDDVSREVKARLAEKGAPILSTIPD